MNKYISINQATFVCVNGKCGPEISLKMKEDKTALSSLVFKCVAVAV